MTYQYQERAKPAVAPAIQPAARSGVNPAGIGLLVDGVMVAGGSVLPWITAGSGLISVLRSGMDGGDGWVSLILGGLIALAGLATLSDNGGRTWIGMLVLSLVTLGAGLYELSDIQGRINSASTTVVAQVGVGLWLIVAGAGIAALSSFGLRARSSGAVFERATPGPRPQAPPDDTWRP